MAEAGSATKQPLEREQVRALLREAVGEERDAVELSDGEFTVCYATDDVVLKVWPEPGTPLLTHEDGLVHAEIEVCRRAAEAGFPAPELLHADLSRRHVGRDWVAMTRLPGTPLALAHDGVDVDRELGEAFARLHRIRGERFGYPGRPALQGTTWRAALGRMLGAVLDDAERFAVPLPFARVEAESALAAAGRALDEVTVPALVHFDAWAGNVLVEDGRLSGVIDGERAFYGDPLAEWAMLAFGREPDDRPSSSPATAVSRSTRRRGSASTSTGSTSSRSCSSRRRRAATTRCAGQRRASTRRPARSPRSRGCGGRPGVRPWHRRETRGRGVYTRPLCRTSAAAGASAGVRCLRRDRRAVTLGAGRASKLLIAAALAALVVSSASAAPSTRGGPQAVAITNEQLMPGVCYQRQVDFTPRGPVVLNVVIAPRPDGSLYTLAPVLGQETLPGTER